MKKIFWFIMMVLGTCVVFAAVDSQYFGVSPSLSVGISMQDPDPVEPGKEVEASFKIENNGTIARGVDFEIVPEYPFSLVPGESASKYIGAIGTSQDGGQNIIVRYRLKVAPDASEGDHKIKVRYKSDGFDSWVTLEDLRIKVQTSDAIIAVEKFFSEPNIVEPGSQTILSMSIKNYASSSLKDVKVVLELGSADTSIPFSPVDSTNEKIIPYMDPLSSKTIEFGLIADPSAQSKSYKVPVSLKYSDTSNRNFSRSNVLTLIIGGEPDTSVGIESSTIYEASTAGVVTVKIVNKGLQDVKFVNIKLANSSSYRMLSPTELYIGNINSDDYKTADFKLYIEKTDDKKVTLPLIVEYKDSNNNNYKKTINLDLSLYSSSEAKKLGLVKGSSGLAWVLAIGIIIAIYVGYRYWKKRKK